MNVVAAVALLNALLPVLGPLVAKMIEAMNAPPKAVTDAERAYDIVASLERSYPHSAPEKRYDLAFDAIKFTLETSDIDTKLIVVASLKRYAGEVRAEA